MKNEQKIALIKNIDKSKKEGINIEFLTVLMLVELRKNPVDVERHLCVVRWLQSIAGIVTVSFERENVKES